MAPQPGHLCRILCKQDAALRAVYKGALGAACSRIESMPQWSGRCRASLWLAAAHCYSDSAHVAALGGDSRHSDCARWNGTQGTGNKQPQGRLSCRSLYLAMRDSAALMLSARCSTRTAASHRSAVCGFFNRACMQGSNASGDNTSPSQLTSSCHAASC